MHMYFTEIKRNLARHPTYFLMMLMVFVLVQSMLVLMWLDARYAYVEYRQMKSSAHANSIYQTQIDMNNSDEQYYLTSDEALRAAVVYRESLESLPGMIPFEAQLTPLCTTEDTVSMPSAFVFGYEGGQPLPTGVDQYRSGLNGMRVTANTLEMFHMKLLSGRFLSEDSYQYEAGKPVEAVLGYAYREFFQVGDTIRIQAAEPIELLVVGILTDSCTLPTALFGPGSMDRLILIPSYREIISCVSHKGDTTEYMRELYMNKMNPYLLLTDNSVDPANVLIGIIARMGFGALRLTPLVRAGLETLRSASRQNLSLTFGLIILAFGASLFAVATLVGVKLRTELRAYAIYVSTGSRLSRIAGFLAAEIGILIVPSACVSLALLRPAFPYGYHLPFLLPRLASVCGLVFLAGWLPAFREISKLNVASLMHLKQ